MVRDPEQRTQREAAEAPRKPGAEYLRKMAETVQKPGDPETTLHTWKPRSATAERSNNSSSVSVSVGEVKAPPTAAPDSGSSRGGSGEDPGQIRILRTYI